MRLIALFFLTTLLLGFTCERDETSDDMIVPVDITQLTGKWKLLQTNGFNVTLVIEPVIQTWERLPDKVVKVSGESAVNQYSASLSYDAPDQPKVVISSISSTKRGGPAEAMQFEQTYFAQLRAVDRYELTTNNRLRLHYTGTQPGVLLYEKVN
jgi:heat shock protein HslJ